MQKVFALTPTTQGPAYPPSEVMDRSGDFVVVGHLLSRSDSGAVARHWGQAIVDRGTEIPPFGAFVPYQIKRVLTGSEDFELYTLPLPLVGNNYPVTFAPAQRRAVPERRPSLALHEAYIPDARPSDGRRLTSRITLRQWLKARGTLSVRLVKGGSAAEFGLAMEGLIPTSLYTVMALREHDLDPKILTRPGPLGIPNVFVTNVRGQGRYEAVMPHCFPQAGAGGNRIVNVIVLWMSSQMSYGGAVGYYGLGGDIHAQLKLADITFDAFTTMTRRAACLPPTLTSC